MLKKISFLFINLFVFLINSYSQQAVITGLISDAGDKTTLIGASAILLNSSDSTVYKGNTTDLNGLYSITAINNGSYIFKASYIGYTDYFQKIEITGDTLKMPPIALQTSSKLLKDVVVSSKAPTAVQKDDTTQYNANSYKTNPDANAEDLVTKMAGITSENGTVKAHGEDVKRVLVDGKPFFGDDVNAVLKNLPADVIDKIQVFDQQSEQSQFTGINDGNTTKTLNIITKPGMKNGTFGKLAGGYGYKDVYKMGGNVNFFNDNRRLSIMGLSNNINEQNFSAEDLAGVASAQSRGGNNRGGMASGGNGNNNNGAGNFLVNDKNGIATTHSIGINYTDKWSKNLEVSGSYFLNQSNNNTLQFLHRDYLLMNDSGRVYNENSSNNVKNINHRINMKLEWKIDTNNSILFTPKFSLQQTRGTSKIFGETIIADLFQSKTTNRNISTTTAYNFSDDLLFRHKFKKKGRTFSVTVSSGFNSADIKNYLYAENQYFIDSAFTNVLDQQSFANKKGTNLGSNFMYTEPLDDKNVIVVNYTNSFQFNNSEKKTYNFIAADNIYSKVDTALSNQFDNAYVTHKAGLGYRFNTKKIQWTLNANYQRSTLNSEQSYPYFFKLNKRFENVLPSFMFRYNFNTKTNLRVVYRAQTNAPSISQLQNVLNNTNPIQLSIGNPDLKQSYDNTVFIRFSKSNTEKSTSLFIMISGTYSNNYITNSTYLANKDTIIRGINLINGMQLTTPVNVSGYSTARGFISYAFPLSPIKSILTVTGGTVFTKIPGMINNKINTSESRNYNIAVTLSSNISKNVDFMLTSNSNFTDSKNSLNFQLNNNYFNQNSRLKTNFIILKNVVFSTELNHQYYKGLSAGYNTSFLLWNAGLGYKFLREQRGEFRISVFDILGQNQSVTRTITEIYIEDAQTNLLQRYFMLTFSYTIKSFKTKTTD